MHGDGGDLGLVDQLLVTMGIGQQHAVLVEPADGAFQLDAAHQKNSDLTAVLAQPVEGRILPVPEGEGLLMVE